MLHFRVDTYELQHPDGRVLVFDIPPRPAGEPLHLNGTYLMRTGEELVPMTAHQLRRIFAEGEPSWLEKPAKTNLSADEVISLLDTQAYFDLMKLSYPTTREGVLARLASENLIIQTDNTWTILNLGGILFAKNLEVFPLNLSRKAARVVIYTGFSKLETQDDKCDMRGYAVCFESLVDSVHSSAPQNYFIEQVLRKEIKMFPKQALRELIANAMVHQDFLATGTSIMIEIFSDRAEISNPGTPSISVNRFIDAYQSRNEKLANLMRRLGICEEKGSGIDKVIQAVESAELPPPDFRAGEVRTTALLFARQDFSKMSKADRIRAYYQHCCLLHVNNHSMSNQTLRERFKLADSKSTLISVIIGATKEAGLIKLDEEDLKSTRFIKYIPFWA